MDDCCEPEDDCTCCPYADCSCGRRNPFDACWIDEEPLAECDYRIPLDLPDWSLLE